MPNSRTIMLFAIILTMLGQGSFTLYVPSLPALAHDLSASSTQIKFTLTIFLLAYGISQIFYGPISDIFGRKKPLIFGVALIIIGSIWTIFVKDLWTFNLYRVIQGIGAGATMVLIRAALRDTLSGTDLAKGTALLSIGFAIGIGIFPVIGGVLTHWFAWQSEFIFLTIISVIILFLTIIYFPETLDKNKEKSQISKYSNQVIKQYWQVIIDKVFWLFLLSGMSAYAVIIIYNVMTPFLFQKIIGLSAQEYGLISIVIGFPYWLGGFVNMKFVKKTGDKILMLLGAFIIILSGIFLLILKFSINPINIYIVIIPLCFAVFGQSLIWSNAIAESLHNFPRFAGVASSIFSCFQLAIAAIIAAILAVITETNQLPLAITILVVGILSALILLFAFWVNEKQS